MAVRYANDLISLAMNINGNFLSMTSTFIRDGKVPADREQSFIVCLYKGKGDMLWTEATIEDIN